MRSLSFGEPVPGSIWVNPPAVNDRTRRESTTSGWAPAGGSAGDGLLARAGAYSLRRLLAAGFAMLLGWLAMYVLLFSRALWDTPSLVADRWPAVFYRIQSLLPWDLVVAERYSPLGVSLRFMWAGLAILLAILWLISARSAMRLPGGDAWIAREGLRIVLAGLVLFSLLGLFSVGLASNDVFSYIWYGKMVAVYHASPFTHAPSDFAAQDPQNWLGWVFWKDQPAVYGPLWAMLAGGLSWLSEALGGDIVTHVLSHRILAAVTHIANTLLVWQLAGKLIPRIWPRLAGPDGGCAGARLAATIFYGWCPLLIWEFANNAHNDGLMAFWVLLAIGFHLRGVERRERTGDQGHWWLLAIAALTLAALVKAIAVLLLPAYVLLVLGAWSWRRGWGRRLLMGAQALGVVLLLGVSLYAPFWEGARTVQAVIDAPGNRMYINSFGGLMRLQGPELVHALARTAGLVPAPAEPRAGRFGQGVPERMPAQMAPAAWSVQAIGDRVDGPIRHTLMALAATLILVATLRVRDLRGLINNWGWILVAYLLVGAVWFWPWYLSWLVPIAALAGPGRLWRVTGLYCAGAWLLYAII